MHIYQCCTCNKRFNAGGDYNSDPSSRLSPCCSTNPVQYVGYVGRLPYVQGDYLGGNEGLLNHADGKTYDSKSAYLKAVKDAGCEVIGNDTPVHSKPSEVDTLDRDIAEAYKQHS